MIIIRDICPRFPWRDDGAVGKSCAVDLRVAGSCPAGQLLIYFTFLQFLQKLCVDIQV